MRPTSARTDLGHEHQLVALDGIRQSASWKPAFTVLCIATELRDHGLLAFLR